MERAVFCLVRDEITAQDIVMSLRAAGFSGDDISVLFPDQGGTRDFAHEQHTKAPEGAAAGAATGGILGGVKGAVTGILIGAGGVLVATEGKDVDLPIGTVLRVRFDSEVPLEATRH